MFFAENRSGKVIPEWLIYGFLSGVAIVSVTNSFRIGRLEARVEYLLNRTEWEDEMKRNKQV